MVKELKFINSQNQIKLKQKSMSSSIGFLVLLIIYFLSLKSKSGEILKGLFSPNLKASFGWGSKESMYIGRKASLTFLDIQKLFSTE